MSGFHRSNLYQDEEDEEGMIDFSGFLGGMPNEANPRMRQAREEPPKVTTRPRGQAPPSSNASGGVSSPNVGYVYTRPVLVDEPEDPKFYHALSPFWADDDSLGTPKLPAISKVAGVTMFTLASMYQLGTRKSGGSPAAKAAMLLGTALYVHPVLGVNHGVLKVIPGEDHWIAKYPRYGGIGMIHLGGAYVFGKGIKKQVFP